MRLSLVIMLFVAISLLSGCATQTQSSVTPSETNTSESTIEEGAAVPTSATYGPPTEAEVKTLDDLARASIVRMTTNKGVIDLELYPDDAPVHVANFLKLAQSGFYDGLIFHRVEPNFVVQGGDPLGNGMGGPGYQIKAEFNARKHLTGTLAMARSADPDSAGSQFYMTLTPQPALDGGYTVFGQVISDLAVLPTISRGDVIQSVKILPKPSSN